MSSAQDKAKHLVQSGDPRMLELAEQIENEEEAKKRADMVACLEKMLADIKAGGRLPQVRTVGDVYKDVDNRLDSIERSTRRAVREGAYNSEADYIRSMEESLERVKSLRVVFLTSEV